MAEANDQQMQQFANERVRVFAEQFRAVLSSARDHKSAIDAVFERAAGSNRWNDARTDGPPKLLVSGNAANPDDMLNFNAFVSALIDIIDGAGTPPGVNDAANAATLRSTWAVLVDACVRPIGQAG